jgi:hypothetical protein
LDINHPDVEKAINLYGKEKVVLIFDTENQVNLYQYHSNMKISELLKGGWATTNKLPIEFETTEHTKQSTLLVNCLELVSKLSEANKPEEILKIISQLYGNSENFPNIDKIVFKDLDILVKFSGIRITKCVPSHSEIAFFKNDIIRNSINLDRNPMKKIIMYLILYPFVYNKIGNIEIILNSGVLDIKNFIISMSQLALNLGLSRNQLHYEIKNLDIDSLIKFTNMRITK